MSQSLLQHAPDKKIQNYQFSFKAKIGKGAYGTVYLGKNVISDQIVAIKVIDKKIITSDYASQLLAQEIAIMKKMNNKYIVKLLDVLHSANNTYIITEYCPGGDLREFLKKNKNLSEEDAISIFKQLLLGNRELLKNNIIHRDIKPANILIHEGTFKLTDFGFAKQVDNSLETLMNSLVGTPLYMSPQILKREAYTSKCDIWSLGLIFYEMIYGATPWHSSNLVELMEKLEKQPLSFPSKITISETTKAIIKGCLQIKEENRISWEELFEHPMLQISMTPPKDKQNYQTEPDVIYNISALLNENHEKNSKLRSTSNNNLKAPNKLDVAKLINQTQMQPGSQRTFRNYLDQLSKTKQSPNCGSRIKTEHNRDRSHSNIYGYVKSSTQKIELNYQTPPLISEKQNSKSSSENTSALQSHSTNTSSNNQIIKKEDIQVTEFQIENKKKPSITQNIFKINNQKQELKKIFAELSTVSIQRIKRTHSLSTKMTAQPYQQQAQQVTFGSKKNQHIYVLKLIGNQLDLISNNFKLKNTIQNFIKQHKEQLKENLGELIYCKNDLAEVKELIKRTIDLQYSSSDYSMVQIQVLIILLINYSKLINTNIQTGNLNIPTNIQELTKQNQLIQQNQLKIEQNFLKEMINEQLLTI